MTTPRTGTAALEEFQHAKADDRPAAFRRLVASVWDAGTLTPEAGALAPALTGALAAAGPDADPGRLGHLAILVGLLVEAKEPDEAVAAAARGAVGGFLELFAATDDPGLTTALVYLLGHFPDDRARILAAAHAKGVGEDDLSRLDRCLRAYDPADTIGVLRFGRSFPSPAAWTVSDEELRQVGGWVQWAGLTDDVMPLMWAGETGVLLGYSGAKALWCVEHGDIVDTPEFTVHGDSVDDEPSGGDDAWLERYLPIMRCVTCASGLERRPAELACTGCDARYPVADGFVDVIGGEDDIEDPLMARFHERWLRPAFMRLIGGNWAGEVTFADENRWVTELMRPAAGPILDLGPGAGITTKTLADKYGTDRIIAMDRSASMMARLSRRVAGAAAVRASATAFPFADASLGGMNCWNMLHYFKDKTEVLREVGRCLQPGGSFVLMDLVPDRDPVSGYFQSRMGENVVRDLFDADQVAGWLADAGMTIDDISFPGGNFMILRAVRTPG
jgi:SAM-dependent methyltransferase